MSRTVLKVTHLTKDYGEGRGVFDINFEVKQGEVFGYVGTNGSGKTTTIRNLMGFIRPDQGTTSVLDMDSWQCAADIMQHVSYIPGEIAFPSLSTGTDFLKLQAEYFGVQDYTYMNHLIEVLQLDPTANLKRMSKGMKQKTAIVAALMGEKDILVMDEPTTGLDPLMRDSFIDLIREEKKKRRTILMSSHIFEEIEEVCDKVGMIKDGKLIDVADLYELRHSRFKSYTVTFHQGKDLNDFISHFADYKRIDDLSCEIHVRAEDTQKLLQLMTGFNLQNVVENKLTLEKYFMNAYERKTKE